VVSDELGGYLVSMSPSEDQNRRLLRARDAMDRDFGRPLDLPALARIALMSPAHFTRTFRATFGETPHRYLQRRRIERAMAMLRDRCSVTDTCFAVGFDSPATFSRTFRAIVGIPPSQYRAAATQPLLRVSVCFVKTWSRPSSFGQAPAVARV
jgi:transcriptional regulator GlxA family with amidase domain